MRRVVTAACILLACLPFAVLGFPVPGLYNTGVDDARRTLPDDAVDPHYTTTLSSDPTAQGSKAYVISTRYSGWVGNTATAKWIGYTNIQGTATPEGAYRYETHFNLTGMDPASARIHLRFYTDDSIAALLLNGTNRWPAGQTSTYQGAAAQIDLNDGFVPADNKLEIVVENGLSQTGIFLEFTSSVCQLPSTPPIFESNSTNQSVFVGQDADFVVAAVCGSNASYQWRKNGQPIPGQTGALLHLANVATNDSGSYDVVASNAGGSSTNQPAQLLVIDPSSRLTLRFDPDLAVPLLTVEGFSNLEYRVEYEDAFPSDLGWQLLGSVTTSADGTAEIRDMDPALPARRFYRAVFTQP